MFIKYDALDMYELFLSEPVNRSDNEESGDISYSKSSKHGFKLTLHLDIYALRCDIYLMYKDKDVFNATFHNITNLIKVDDSLTIKSQDKKILVISFNEDFRISIQ